MPPELIFDAGFGELFIIRVAGNVLSPEIAGSLQYAGQHLHTPLFVVLGHTNCGAIAAAIDTRLRGTRHHSRIQLLVDMHPARIGRSRSATHARRQCLRKPWRPMCAGRMRQILETPEGRERQVEGRVKLVGAIYEIETGLVRFLE